MVTDEGNKKINKNFVQKERAQRCVFQEFLVSGRRS